MALTTLQDTRYKRMPTPEDLYDMTRDLHFHPIHNDHPSVLKIDEIETFNREGYLKGFNIYSEDEIRDIRQKFDEMIEIVLARRELSETGSSAKLSSLQP